MAQKDGTKLTKGWAKVQAAASLVDAAVDVVKKVGSSTSTENWGEIQREVAFTCINQLTLERVSVVEDRAAVYKSIKKAIESNAMRSTI